MPRRRSPDEDDDDSSAAPMKPRRETTQKELESNSQEGKHCGSVPTIETGSTSPFGTADDKCNANSNEDICNGINGESADNFSAVETQNNTEKLLTDGAGALAGAVLSPSTPQLETIEEAHDTASGAGGKCDQPDTTSQAIKAIDEANASSTSSTPGAVPVAPMKNTLVAPRDREGTTCTQNRVTSLQKPEDIKNVAPTMAPTDGNTSCNMDSFPQEGQGTPANAKETKTAVCVPERVDSTSILTEDPTIYTGTADSMMPQTGEERPQPLEAVRVEDHDVELAGRVAQHLLRNQPDLQAHIFKNIEIAEAIHITSMGNHSPSDASDRSEGPQKEGGICGLSRKTYCVILFCLLLVGGVVGAVVAVTSSGGSKEKTIPTPLPTLAPTSAVPTLSSQTLSPTMFPTAVSVSRRESLLSLLKSNMESAEAWDLFDNPITPQAKALQWMSEDDPESANLLLRNSTDLLLERFSVVVLYFSTIGPETSFDFPFLEGSTSVCKWNNGGTGDNYRGVFCANSAFYDAVSIVALHGLNLTGSIPWDEISLLGQLENLYLYENMLVGSVPSQLSTLSKLVVLSLYSNSLTGGLPSNMPENIETLSFSENSLSGTIPSEWASSMTSLTHLYMSGNQLKGSIPWEAVVSYLPHLKGLTLGSNRLTGSVPAELGNLSQLTSLALEANMLEGPLPATFPDSLEFVSLYNNSFSGTLPISSWSSAMTSLTYLDMGLNAFVGTIPSTLGSVTTLTRLFLERNGFSGTLPTDLGGLTNLEVLWLFGNQLTGTVPEEFGNLSQLTSLGIHATSLTGSLDSIFCALGDFPSVMYADCRGPNREIECSCCSNCCYSSGNSCDS